MYSKILIRFGELSLKGKNKSQFIKKLVDNIKNLTGEKVVRQHDRLFMDYSEKNMNDLQRIFGIYSYSPVIEVATDRKIIEEQIVKNAHMVDGKKYRVSVTRGIKVFDNSMELEKEWGSLIWKNCKDPKVDLKKFDIDFEIEIRKDKTYIFFERVLGAGGFPVGINGRVIHLISGGIDSPVAAYEMMKKGIQVDFLNFITPPHTDQKTIDKVNQIVTHLSKYQGKCVIYRSNYTDLMNLINMTSDQSYKITLMRRSFYRIASQLAIRNGYLGISNGESLGQVASQTLESMNVIQDQALFPIYRPVLSLDKSEIITKAEKIGTYVISSIRASESCELFAPENPVTKPKLWMAQKLEKELGERLDEYERKNLDSLDVVLIGRK